MEPVAPRSADAVKERRAAFAYSPYPTAIVHRLSILRVPMDEDAP